MTHKQQKKKTRSEASAETITSGIEKLAVDANNVQSHVPVNNETETGGLSNLSENFTVDDSTYVTAKIRATFYPKFENEKSDQEVRNRMIELVSKGLAILEVSLKHSGSLFMYAGHEGGAYAKNSYGNVYTAVGVFVLGRVFREAWGTQASKKQAEFNEFLEREPMSISMELVTADLGDHGQRPREDYVVVTAVTELGNRKPRFYSTPDIIAFCTKWRLPTNHMWLFSTRNSVTSFFAAYDALCEEGTATSVCKVLDEVADISVPGSIDHIKMQGEILEGLVARIVRHESIKEMQLVLQNYPSPVVQVDQDLGPGLREISAAYRSDDEQTRLNLIKALLQNTGTSFCPDYVDWFDVEDAGVLPRADDNAVVDKFLQAIPTDYSTTKLLEMIRLMRKKSFPVSFKCYYNFHKVNSISSHNLHYKMVIRANRDREDRAFSRYQEEMRCQPDLWPLYRGFMVEINLFKASKEKAEEIAKTKTQAVNNGQTSYDSSTENGLADADAHLMIKLKFLTYKLRTFLIRNGLSELFKREYGPAAYKTYYIRQMESWNISLGKQRNLSKMLDEWAVYIRRKCGDEKPSSSTYLSEAEPFLEQYAKRSPENQVLLGYAGNLVRSADFLAIVEVGRDEEGDFQTEKGDYIMPISEKRKSATADFAAIDVRVADIRELLLNISEKDTNVKTFLKNRNLKSDIHVTLAHKRSHGVTAVANYSRFENQNVPVDVTALLFSDTLAALETQPGSIDGEKISSKNEWPHLTLWTAQGIPPKEANTLPKLVLQGKATRIKIDPPFRITGILRLH